MAYKPKVLIVPEGGTGVIANTAYAVLCGGTTSTGAIQSIASVGTAGQLLTSNGAGALPTFQDASGGGSSSSTIDIFTEWLANATDSAGFSLMYDLKMTTSVKLLFTSSSYSGVGLATNPGICVLDLGTNNNEYASCLNYQGCYLFGAGTYSAEFLIYAPVISTSSQRYTLYIGFGNNDRLGTEYTNGAYFVYSDNINSGNWQMKTADNGTRTTANSSTAFSAATWTKLRVDVNANGTSVSFFVNGSEVANSPITTNIPTATGREVGTTCMIKKSVGTTARVLWVDYVHEHVELTTAR